MKDTIDHYYKNYSNDIEELTKLRLASTSINSSYGRCSYNCDSKTTIAHMTPMLNATVGFTLWKIEMDQNEQLLRDIGNYVISLSETRPTALTSASDMVDYYRAQDMKQLEDLAYGLAAEQNIS